MTDGEVVCEGEECGAPATKIVRHGLKDHPYCDDCAGWWGDHRVVSTDVQGWAAGNDSR